MTEKKAFVHELQPEEVDFKCFKCGAPCKLFPRKTPMAAVHAETDEKGNKLPVCEAWEESKTKDRLYTFLKHCGLPVGYEEADHGPS